MSRKLFYFVRHGESILNTQSIRQAAEGALSNNGRDQAHDTGMRLAKHPIQVIIASPYERTKETAAIINKCFNKPKQIEYSDLLRERKNPSEIVGKSMFDLKVRQIVDQIDKSYHNDDFRFSDEENFIDLKNRAKELLKYLETRREKYILLVTHGIFLRMVVAYILYGDKLDASTYNTLSFFNATSNAGITICECKRSWFSLFPKTRWELLAWNDYPRNKLLKRSISV